MSDEIPLLSAEQLVAKYRSRSLSPVDVTSTLLDRIERLDQQYNAMWLVKREAALATARQSEARWIRGVPLSNLDGVPITIKDNIATAGDPTPIGIAGNLDSVAKEDAPPVARVREAGLVILGKTTMPDYGMLAAGVSSLHGITRNPWNPEFNTAGSSSGAGAALAAGFAPLALGTDIGGSVRAPAAACGCVALKPSFGRVPIDPPYLGRTTGPMARSATDAAQLLDLLSKPDQRDYTALPPSGHSFANLHPQPVRHLRIGLALEAGGGLPVVPEIQDRLLTVAKQLADHGALIVEVEPFVTTTQLQALDLLWRARALCDLNARAPAFRSRVLPFIQRWSESAASSSAVDAAAALNSVFALRKSCVDLLGSLDFLLTPTMPIDGWEADYACPGNDPSRPYEHLAFLSPFNQSEQPALSLPMGLSSRGLPIALQIVGKRFDDEGVLSLAMTVEGLLPKHHAARMKAA